MPYRPSHTKKMKFDRFCMRSVSAVAAMLWFANAAWAVDPFTVRDIRVEGLQRVEAGTVFASLPVPPPRTP